VQADITEQDAEAIVNAANSSLLGGGGVDGAIHRAGGPVILEECRRIRAEQGECATGSAVVTGGGNLRARYVIHAVGPVWHGGGSGEDALLASAYRSCLEIARTLRINSIAFPCISTGVYHFPADRAALIALSTVKEFVKAYRTPRENRFVVYSDTDYQLYRELLSSPSS
jgi:O-acetyl-ADP-ribose deacetylase (regulator of RNase III)